MDNTSLAAQYMSIDNVLAQLSSLKDNSADNAKAKDADPIWQTDVEALEAAINIISALQDEGITDAEGVKDLIFDYNALGKQYKDLHRLHIKAASPIHKDGVWHCPECNSRVNFNHSFCHRCGKRIGGWKK